MMVKRTIKNGEKLSKDQFTSKISDDNKAITRFFKRGRYAVAICRKCGIQLTPYNCRDNRRKKFSESIGITLACNKCKKIEREYQRMNKEQKEFPWIVSDDESCSDIESCSDSENSKMNEVAGKKFKISHVIFDVESDSD